MRAPFLFLAPALANIGRLILSSSRKARLVAHRAGSFVRRQGIPLQPVKMRDGSLGVCTDAAGILSVPHQAAERALTLLSYTT
jgi:hypothetical protein